MDANLTLSDALQDLITRFIMNIPSEELSSLPRVLFQVEQAHWFYEDYMVPNSKLPSMPFRSFSEKIFAVCPLLRPALPMFEEAMGNWVSYKLKIPSCGAIIVDDSYSSVLMVKLIIFFFFNLSKKKKKKTFFL